jgi:uroporphyrinogen III methyltransferase / synthase
MGVARLREITGAFIEHGAAPATPIALTRWATTGAQKTITGTLATIADIAEAQDFGSPAVAVIGDVVNEREKINWFEKRPLFGKRIVVTRTREQAGGLSKALRDLGADVIELPTIRIEPPEDRLIRRNGHPRPRIRLARLHQPERRGAFLRRLFRLR